MRETSQSTVTVAPAAAVRAWLVRLIVLLALLGPGAAAAHASEAGIQGAQYFNYAIASTVSNGVPAPGAGNIEVTGAEDYYHFSVARDGERIFVDQLSATS